MKYNNFLKISSCNFEAPINIDDYLLRFLSSTSPNTNYWDSPSEANLKGLGQSEISRIVNQSTEINTIIRKTLSDTKRENFYFLDVGTGNGMVPKFLNVINQKIYSTAIDPFLHGGHKTSWQQSNFEDDIKACIKYLKTKFVNDYSELNKDYMNRYIEKKIYLEEHIKEKSNNYDCVYCKAIEHIPNWIDFTKQICSVVESEGILIFKHRSFFSYLGAHRYASTGIPWGHCLLNEEEYIDYAKKFHNNRHKEMCDFFFKGLSYPRMTISELIQLCIKNKFSLESLFIEKPRYHKIQNEVINEYSELVKKVLLKNEKLSFEEMTSGLITLVFKKY